MRISHVKLTNWRSCREISFAAGRMTALVGANNAGKTAILSALNFLMGSKWPSNQGLEDSDFFGRTRREGMKVQVWFEPGSEYHSAWYEFAKEGEGQTGGKVQFKVDGTAYALKNENRDKFPLIYINAERSFEYQFGVSRYTLFGQALRKLEEHFASEVPDSVKVELGGHLNAAQAMLRTDLYDSFVKAVSDAFGQQLQHTQHSLQVDFKSFDPFHFYKSLHPFLTEDGKATSATEAGSGLRNMIVLALFRAYGKTFRGDGIVVIEEPEMYLHPHAQRGLMRMFQEIAANGTQILYSTHSAAFVDIERFDGVVVVERCPDPVDDDLCTTVRSLTAPELVARVKKNRPGEDIRIEGIRERYHHACGAEHTEALFGRVVVLVEGATEAACLPLYADGMDMNLDALGVSVVNARGKDNLESLHHVYAGLGFPVYVIFDNDLGKPSKGTKDVERRQTSNRRLTKLLCLTEIDAPAAVVGPTYAVMGGDFEQTLRREIGAASFDQLKARAAELYGSDSKPMAARFMADHLTLVSEIPGTVRSILESISILAGRPLGDGRWEPPQPPPKPKSSSGLFDDLDDDLPF